LSVKILLVDDHKMMREALRLLLSRHQEFSVVADAGNGSEALEMAAKTDPDIVLMDVDMPEMGGIEATRRLAAKRPEVKVIGLSAYPDRLSVSSMLKAGAAGYVTKSQVGDELFRAIHAVMGNQTYLCPIASSAMAKTGRGRYEDGRPKLAPREREVLSLLAQGLQSPAIGLRLNIASSTVEVHRRNIMRKVGLHSIAELTKYAIREGLATA